MKKDFYIVLLIALLVTACGVKNTSPDSDEVPVLTPVPNDFAGITNPLGSEAAGEGAVIYKNYCASCHGETGKGDGVAGQSLEPKPKDLSQLSTIVGDDYLFWRINTGKEGTAMIGWGGILEEEQIWQVASFIRGLE